MSTSVTVRQTTTHTSSEVAIIVLNFGHFKTLSGILQVLQTVVGLTCMSLLLKAGSICTVSGSIVFLLLLSFGYFVTTLIILVTCLLSMVSSSVLQNTLFFLGYHGLGFILYLTGGLALLIQSTTGRPQKRELVIPAAVMGLINCGLYLTLFIVAYKKFR
ncbi:uncharacterized protein LOC143255055 isoform X1 [Tachypleus tridentatus]|uniref:uncharacterized protein LOC143255055 isoform X1 n=1 Tax=Tachypleus tridentatus TaxID=6853 RepID=UPI003FD5FFEB